MLNAEYVNRIIYRSAYLLAAVSFTAQAVSPAGLGADGAGNPVSEVVLTKESSYGFNGLVGGLAEFGAGSTAEAARRTGVQVEVVSMAPLGGCVPSDAGSAPAKVTYIIRSPFLDKSQVYSTIGCGEKPDNLFMEELADRDGWVRELPLGDAAKKITPALGRQAVPLGLAVSSPVTAKLRWRWELDDNSIGPWQIHEFRIGPTDATLSELQASR